MTDTEVFGGQAMLFGSVASSPDAVTRPRGQLRVCTLNVQGTGQGRCQPLADWLVASGTDVLMLTEMRDTDSCRALLESLRAEGFTTTVLAASRRAGTGVQHAAAVAVRNLPFTVIDTGACGPRVAAADISADDGVVRLAAIYAPANGMSPDSSRRRCEFQNQVLTWLQQVQRPVMIVTGDLNVVEPSHVPRLVQFEEHDYAFYTDLRRLGLRDAYRELHPDGGDHSWFSDRFGDQRIDHTFVGTGVGGVLSCRYDRATIDDKLSDHAAMLTTVSTATSHTTGAGAPR